MHDKIGITLLKFNKGNFHRMNSIYLKLNMLVVDLLVHKVTKAFGVRVRDYVIDFCRGVFFFHNDT